MKFYDPILGIDFYKSGHVYQYPQGVEQVYSNMTSRSLKYMPKTSLSDNKTVWWGLQGVIKWLLIEEFNEKFFQRPLDVVLAKYKRRMDTSLGPGAVRTDHIRALHNLGYLPLAIKALDEGTRVPVRVPYMTFYNTHPEFGWLTNYMETMLSAELWKKIVSASIAYEFRRLFEHYGEITGASKEFTLWQGHDFSFRGCSGIFDAACNVGPAHLTSFLGTDTVPALDYLEEYYSGLETFLGGSVAATEHSVMCMGGTEGEQELVKRLITQVYPSGVVSIVSDTWDYWNFITYILPSLKEEILNRQPDAMGFAKFVVRPDSGTPDLILNGDPSAEQGSPQLRGTFKCLWDIFGGDTNQKGFRTLSPRIGTIYGDSINLESAEIILDNMALDGFTKDNVVFGVGSFTYQHVTRDSTGNAIKATFGIVDNEERELYKAPKTDSGMKNSARGLLRVQKDMNGELILLDQRSMEEEQQGELKLVFQDGKLLRETTIAQVRERLWPTS